MRERVAVDGTGINKNGSVVRWVSIVGARPQFVKLAPVCRAIEVHNRDLESAQSFSANSAESLNLNSPQNHSFNSLHNLASSHIEHCIIHTGQHYDREVAEMLFMQMQIPSPFCNLGVGSGSHGVQLARMLARLEPVLASKKPDWVVVYGDTNSTLAGAILAARLGLPLAHVEAGCRSHDSSMPEEQNRIVADHLSRLLLAPSQLAIENLHREGIGSSSDPLCRRVVMVGDVMYDALLQGQDSFEDNAFEKLAHFGLEPSQYYLLTLHRAENTDSAESLKAILETVGALDLPVLFPVHPRTKHFLESAEISLNRAIRPVPPLGYHEMLTLEKHARKILTDSGGVQKEAFYLGVPCVTLRERTEWPETVELGANRIAGNTPETILKAIHATEEKNWLRTYPYGDGRAAHRIVEELLSSGAQTSVEVLKASTAAAR